MSKTSLIVLSIVLVSLTSALIISQRKTTKEALTASQTLQAAQLELRIAERDNVSVRELQELAHSVATLHAEYVFSLAMDILVFIATWIGIAMQFALWFVPRARSQPSS